MNAVVLSCMRLCLREERSWRKELIAAFLGALFYCILFFLPFWGNRVLCGVYFLAISMGMVAIAFPVFGKPRKWIFYVAVQYLTAGAISGVMNLFFYGGKTGSMAGFLFAVVTAWNVIRFATCLFYGKKQMEENCYQVTITLNGKTKTVSALLDTGNSLIEPFSHAFVAVGDREGLKELFDCEEQKEIEQFYKTGDFEIKKKIRLIPYRAVGVRTGILISYPADEFVIQTNGEEIKKKGVYLAVSPVKISSDGSYELLLHPGLLRK